MATRMQPGTKCIKIRDTSTGNAWFYDPNARCSSDSPKELYAQTSYMALRDAFSDIKMLQDMHENDIIFLESPDYTSRWDSEINSIVPCAIVWRHCMVLGPAVYPGKK